MFCGWDWGSTRHGVCLIDDNGLVVKTWMIEHTERSLSALFAELARLGDPGSIPVAIERGEGLIVGLIAGAGRGTHRRGRPPGSDDRARCLQGRSAPMGLSWREIRRR